MRRLGYIPKIDCTYAKWYIGYSSIPMRSGYELAYAHYLDAKGVIWQYEPYTFWIGPSRQYLGKTYTPDFWVPIFNTFIEIKGRYSVRDRHKIEAFKKAYPKYQHVVLKGKDFRLLVGRKFMEMGGTAPKVIQAGLLATINSQIVYR